MSDPQKLVYAAVILDTALDKPLDYKVPEHLIDLARPGSRVSVPLRKSPRKGTILYLKDTPSVAKVEHLLEILSEKHLPEDLFLLSQWMAKYYCAPFRKVLKSILPPSIRSDFKHKEQLFVKAALSANQLQKLCLELRNNPQALVIDILLKHPKGILLSELMEKAGVSRSPITTLVKKKVIICQNMQIERSPLYDQEYFPTKPKTLNVEQKSTLEKIQKSLDQRTFETHLLHGVTGSGKTEVYLQAIDHALKQKKGAIILVPEIALTSQTIDRLRGRFKEKIAVLHYRLSQGERHDAWHQIQSAKAQIVIGARSALFSPVDNLGLIIVDEEHESSYKQNEESPCYHARDVAVMRGKLASATVILGSATPSLESYHNALSGKYNLSLLIIRADHASMPKVTIVDMRKEFDKAKGFTLFSDQLLDSIKKRLSVGEQTLLFLNRRGYHTQQMCLQCGEVITCPHCDVSLTFHLGENTLACHLCNYLITPPRSCPSCGKDGTLKFKGVGTELVERSLHAIFPEVRTLRLDADTTRHKGSHELLFKQFRSGKADVLIGTQMIAKGLHFPSVTLVGILNADSSLNIPDFRAAEQTFQLLTQVSGRSGRGSLSGEVIIQTALPNHPTILLAKNQDYTGFYNEEIAIRRHFNYPPFTHLVKISFSGDSLQKTQNSANAMRSALIAKLPAAFELHPVIPAGHARVKDRYRFQFLIKGKTLGPLAFALEELKNTFVLEKEIRCSVDVDPTSTFF